MVGKEHSNPELGAKQVELWTKIVDKGIPLLEKYIESKNNLEKPKFKWGILAFIFILSLMVLVTAFLVYAGKVDGSNFTFLLGTLIGATIAILGDILLPVEN